MLVHQLTDLRQKDHTVLPIWLLEGVAGYYSGQLDECREYLHALIRENKGARIEELDGSSFFAHDGYPFSAGRSDTHHMFGHRTVIVHTLCIGRPSAIIFSPL